MLMSLTMRLRPNCPPVPWGATSVVAIPNLPLTEGRTKTRPNFTSRGTDYYTAVASPRHAKLPARSREEPIWEREAGRKDNSGNSGLGFEELRDVAELIIS